MFFEVSLSEAACVMGTLWADVGPELAGLPLPLKLPGVEGMQSSNIQEEESQ